MLFAFYEIMLMIMSTSLLHNAHICRIAACENISIYILYSVLYTHACLISVAYIGIYTIYYCLLLFLLVCNYACTYQLLYPTGVKE